MILHFDPLLIGQSQNFIVVHHRVHIFDPECIDVAIEEDVLLLVLLRIQRSVDLAKDAAQQSIGPVARERIENSIKLDDSAGLWIHNVQFRGFVQVGLRPTKGFDYDGLSTAGWTDDHRRVTRHHHFVELDHFVNLNKNRKDRRSTIVSH